jgi:hypothetical protein
LLRVRVPKKRPATDSTDAASSSSSTSTMQDDDALDSIDGELNCSFQNQPQGGVPC